MTLRIDQSQSQGFRVFTLTGRIETEHIAQLEELFKRDRKSIVLDLAEVRLADRDAVRFLARCEADGMEVKNCPSYIREWMNRDKE